MIKSTTSLAVLAVMTLAGVAAQRAEAKYVAFFTQDGPNVVEAGGGTLDTMDLTIVGRGALTRRGRGPTQDRRTLDCLTARRSSDRDYSSSRLKAQETP
jgi:hypothetical protein